MLFHISLTDADFFFFSFKSSDLVLRQEHSSGVEGSQPVKEDLCCLDPQGSLHISRVVAQGQEGAIVKNSFLYNQANAKYE